MATAALPKLKKPSVDETAKMPLTVAEYFAGIGLFRMGLEAAGWQVVYANDWSAERAQMYHGFFGDDYHIEDIFSVNPDAIPPATLATCSFPCIDLSLAGKQQGINAKHSGAFWGFYEVLKKQDSQAPLIVLLENVAGWMYSNHGNDFHATAKSLNELGYACDVFMLNARCFVPQSRPRLFMIGVKAERGEVNQQHIGYRSKRLMPVRLKELMTANDSIGWAHLDIPEPPPYKNTGFSDDIVEKMPPDSPSWWDKEKVDKHIQMMSASHLKLVKDLASQDRERFRTFFRRRRADGQRAEVRSDDIAGCLRTAVGGSGKQFLVAAGHGSIRMRTLTARKEYGSILTI